MEETRWGGVEGEVVGLLWRGSMRGGLDKFLSLMSTQLSMLRLMI